MSSKFTLEIFPFYSEIKPKRTT